MIGKSYGSFVDSKFWLAFGLFPPLYLLYHSVNYSYKYNLQSGFIEPYAITALVFLPFYLALRTYIMRKLGSESFFATSLITPIYPIITLLFSFLFLYSQFNRIDGNKLFPNLFFYSIILLFLFVIAFSLDLYKLNILKTSDPIYKKTIKPETISIEKDSIIAQLQSENAELQTRIAELEDLMSSNIEQQPPVDSKPTLQGTKYNTIERETHLLIIGALANLLANPNKNKTRYVKGAGAINQSALNSDIGAEIASLLQPETKSRAEETIKQRVREALNLITKAE